MFSIDAFLFGLAQCLVIGPISLYAIREGLDPERGFWYEMQVFLGATVVDIIYLMLAAYGMAHFVEYGFIKFIMWVLAAYMLIVMGLNTFHERPKRLSLHYVHRHRTKFYETDFFKAVLINLVNPLAVIFWVMVGGSLYADYVGRISPAFFTLSIVSGGLLGSVLVTLLTLFVRSIFHQWMLRKLVKVGSAVLVGYGIFFSFKALMGLAPFLVGLFTT